MARPTGAEGGRGNLPAILARRLKTTHMEEETPHFCTELEV